MVVDHRSNASSRWLLPIQQHRAQQRQLHRLLPHALCMRTTPPSGTAVQARASII